MASFSDHLIAQNRKELGVHCLRQRDIKKANENFLISLMHQPEKLDSVYQLARGKAREAKLDDALEVLKEKSELSAFKDHFDCKLQKCDCLYERNRFEKSWLGVSKELARCKSANVAIPHATKLSKKKLSDGPKVDALQCRFEMIRANFDDIIGKNAGKSLYDQRKLINKAGQKSKTSSNLDDCDVESVLEEKFKHETVKEKHLAECRQRKFAQRYMQSGWKDFEFVKSLKANKTLLESTQNPKSFDIINQEIDDCVKSCDELISQLHARCPMYSHDIKLHSKPDRREKIKGVNRFRMQLLTRRAMFLALDKMLECRERGELAKLIKIAENELGVHYQIKSSRVMPRKEEFTKEICNLIGLTHVDRFKMPTVGGFSGLEELLKIFHVNLRNKRRIVRYVFGDLSSYHDPEESDQAFLTFTTNVMRLEERLNRSKMAIERCYLLHEISKLNLRRDQCDEARRVAREVIEEAIAAKSLLWQFLGQIAVFRANLSQKNVFKINQSLREASELAEVLAIPKLSEVIGHALSISEALCD